MGAVCERDVGDVAEYLAAIGREIGSEVVMDAQLLDCGSKLRVCATAPNGRRHAFHFPVENRLAVSVAADLLKEGLGLS